MVFPIAPMPAEDWPAVEAIEQEGIATGNATFETESPGWEKWHANHHRIPAWSCEQKPTS